MFPGIVLYLSGFYKRSELNLRYSAIFHMENIYWRGISIALFFSAASLSGAFSGLLAAAIENLDGVGGKPGWAWIFILVCCGLQLAFYRTNRARKYLGRPIHCRHWRSRLLRRPICPTKYSVVNPDWERVSEWIPHFASFHLTFNSVFQNHRASTLLRTSINPIRR